MSQACRVVRRKAKSPATKKWAEKGFSGANLEDEQKFGQRDLSQALVHIQPCIGILPHLDDKPGGKAPDLADQPVEGRGGGRSVMERDSEGCVAVPGHLHTSALCRWKCGERRGQGEGRAGRGVGRARNGLGGKRIGRGDSRARKGQGEEGEGWGKDRERR